MSKQADVSKFNRYLKDLENKLTNEAFNKIDTEMEAIISVDMVTTAKNYLASSGNVESEGLEGRIEGKKINRLKYELRANQRNAAYVEFGTGPQYIGKSQSRNKYWDTLAKTFKRPKDGNSAPAPFFYPTVNEYIPKLYKMINRIIAQGK